MSYFNDLDVPKGLEKALSIHLGLWQYQRVCSRYDLKNFASFPEMIRSQQPVQVAIYVALKMASLSNSTTIRYTTFHYQVGLGAVVHGLPKKRPFVEQLAKSDIGEVAARTEKSALPTFASQECCAVDGWPVR